MSGRSELRGVSLAGTGGTAYRPSTERAGSLPQGDNSPRVGKSSTCPSGNPPLRDPTSHKTAQRRGFRTIERVLQVWSVKDPVCCPSLWLRPNESCVCTGESYNQSGGATYGYRAREIDDERSVVDRSGAARGSLSVCRRRETSPAARPDGGASGAAGLVLEVPRRGRGARRARPDPPRASAHPAGSDAAGRRGAGDHHDRSNGGDAGGRYGGGGADERGRGAPRGVRRLRPLAAGTA